MSLNKKFTLKIVRGEEIRALHIVPNTWTELQAALTTMYGTSDFQLTYVDEESDHITVANDLDYSEAVHFHGDKPSMRLYFKARVPEERKTEEPAASKDESFSKMETEEPQTFRGWRGRGGRCRGMGRPPWARTEGAEEANRGWGSSGAPDFISNMMRQGPEYLNNMMRQCPEFLTNLMRGGPELLNNMMRGGPEMFNNMMQGGPEMFSNMMQGGPCGKKGAKKFFKKMREARFGKHNKQYRLKVLQKGFPRRWVVSSGSAVAVSWTVLNKGTMPWPEGTCVQSLRGTFGMVESVRLGEVKPGEIVNIVVNVNVPAEQGKHHGVWGVMVNGECVGELRVKLLAAAETVDAKAGTLESMGFNREQAVRALEESNGDLDVAISTILKNYQS